MELIILFIIVGIIGVAYFIYDMHNQKKIINGLRRAHFLCPLLMRGSIHIFKYSNRTLRFFRYNNWD